MSKKIEMTNAEALAASTEVDWMINEKISFLLNYRLVELRKKLGDALKSYLDVRNEALKPLVDKDGQLKAFVPDGKGGQKPNPKAKEFNDKMEPVDKEILSIEFRKIPLSLTQKPPIVSERPYNMIYSFFENDIEEDEAPEEQKQEQPSGQKTRKKGPLQKVD